MKVTNSIVQSTTLLKHDPKLKYFDPNLLIITHKATPYLKDQIGENKERGHLRQYLNG